MNRRNQRVTAQLQEMYELRQTGQIFCVSNDLYWDHREAAGDISVPFLKLSGIIDARLHCMSIVVSSQHRAASHYMSTEVPAILSQFDLWVQAGAQSGSEEHRTAIRGLLDETETTLRRVRSRTDCLRVKTSANRRFQGLTSRTCALSCFAKSAKQHFAVEIYESACRLKNLLWTSVKQIFC